MGNRADIRTQWEHYPFGTPHRSNNVSHVTHVNSSFRILQDGLIKPTLVDDTDRLNFLKLSVAYVASNEWHDGSIYGNVTFRYNFDKLVGQRKLYWFDPPITRPDAVRFLISETDYSDWLVQYNPSVDKGPLRYNPIDDCYEWAKNIRFELMFEGVIALNGCESLRIIDHHPTKCVRHSLCNQRYKQLKASLLFISGLIANQIKINVALLLDERGKFEVECNNAIAYILRQDTTIHYKNRVKLNSTEAIAVGQACFYFISQRNNSAWELMRENFEDHSDYYETLLQILATHFKVEVSGLENYLQ